MSKVARPEPMVLTDAKIRDLRRPKSGQIEVPDKSVSDLRVRVGISGTKSFVLRKRGAGKYRNIALGRFSNRFGLTDARKTARLLLRAVARRPRRLPRPSRVPGSHRRHGRALVSP